MYLGINDPAEVLDALGKTEEEPEEPVDETVRLIKALQKFRESIKP